MDMSKMKNSSTKGAAPSGRTRLRKIWSCLECRRRRLHCDRVTPVCGRCTRSQKPEKCQYLHTEESAPSKDIEDLDRPTTKPVGSPETLGEDFSVQAAHGQQAISFHGIAKGMQQIEAAVFSPISVTFERHATSVPSTATSIPSIAFATPDSLACPRDSPNKLGRSKEMEGSTSIGSLADGIPGLQDFTKLAFREYPAMGQIRLNMHKMETKSFETHRIQHLPETLELRAYLPLKDEADSQVQLYFAGLDRIYDVLDRADFQDIYEAIWARRHSQHDYSLVVVLLVIAIPMCLRSTSIAPTADSVESYRDRATVIITACQFYIDRHPSRGYTIEELQAQFLLLWAQQLNARRYKQTYVNAGKLIRTYMCASLHRDTAAVRGRGLSDNEKLLRRKIWMAALEFELQAAFEQGMPPASLPTQYDRGMHDAYEDSDTKDGQLSDHLGRCPSSLGFLYESFELRHRLCLLLNNSDDSMSPADAQAIIDVLSGHLTATSASPSASNMVAVLTIRGFLFALHRRQLQHATSAFERSGHRAAIIEHACSMIEASHSFCQTDGPALECLSSHQAHAALSLASVCLTDDSSNDYFLQPFLRTQAHDLLDKTIELIKLRVTRFTGDQRQLWTALAAQALVKIRNGDAGRQEALREAVARYVAAFDGMGLLDRPAIQHGRDSDEPSRAMPGVESWVLDDWFDMEFVDFNTGFQ